MAEHSSRHSEKNETKNALLQVAAIESETAQTRPLLPKEYTEVNSLSPINQLPAEIKVEIFYNALLDDRTDEGPLATPFFLGKICQSWRDFVWSSPILWTNLHLCLSKDRYEAQTNLLRNWLSRSANYPLRFCLTGTEDFHNAWLSNPPVEVLTMFASVSAQWREVEFFLPNTQDCLDAISTAENSLPLLTTATAHLNSTERQLNIFSTAPQLSVLHLYNAYLLKVQAPWHQLREFSSEACTVDEIRGLLHKMPNIIRCSFKEILSVILDDSREIFNRTSMLDHLEYLELWFDWELDATSTRILGPVKLPSLREATVRGTFADEPAILRSIMTSFHSSHLLGKFTLGSTITSDRDLIQVLESIPSISDLWLDFHGQDPYNELLTKELLQRLYPPHTNILLPNLRTFIYIGPTSLNEHMDSFRDLLVYRFRRCALQPTELDPEKRTVCQIQLVSVASSSQFVMRPDIQQELKSLVREGLALSVKIIYS